jgi:hypothetical protein
MRPGVELWGTFASEMEREPLGGVGPSPQILAGPGECGGSATGAALVGTPHIAVGRSIAEPS